MRRPAPRRQSRSLRLYARLLEFYPPGFLERHRAEMLQNFSDLEDEATSKAALWLLIGKDLTMSLVSHFFASRLGHYVIAVLVAWTLFFAIGFLRAGSTPGHPALHVFGGFLIGMLSMYIATRLYGGSQNSGYVVGALVASILLFTIGHLRYPGTVGHPILQVFGGVLLGMLSMYIATRVYGTSQHGSHA
jgi:acid phosphatase family membrane protein YuiD